MARTIVNPITNSAADSSVIRTELQILETEIADIILGHDHDGTNSKSLPVDLITAHNILSAQHGDTLTATVVRGDLMIANSTLKWSRLALGTSGKYLRSDGTDPDWSTIQAADLPTGIDALKIGEGIVSNTEFNHLSGVTSAIQTQLNGKEPTISAGTTAQYWRGDKTWQTLDKSAVGLGNVENTALSTWTGTTNITTLGTIGTGTWNATTIGIAKGGTGQTTASAAFNALSPMTTLGDIIYGGASGAGTRLAGNTTTTKKFLSQIGDGTNSAAPAWDTPGFSSKARAYRATSVQTIGSGSWTKVQFNAESYDVLGEFDSTTNYRFTAKEAGYYQIVAGLEWGTLATDIRYGVGIRVNGTVYAAVLLHSSHTSTAYCQVSDMLYLAANDYIEAFAYQDSGSNKTINNSQTTFIAIHRLS